MKIQNSCPVPAAQLSISEYCGNNSSNHKQIRLRSKNICSNEGVVETSKSRLLPQPVEIMEITDVVYGKIELPPNVAAIVETPIFQRLKHLRQLGMLKLNNALEYEHNRFHHCIGTYHVAGLMLEALEKNTPSISNNNNQIPELYREAVKIAALLHDIGHGPFSHTWERVVDHYTHESISFACVDSIFATIDASLFPELRANNKYGIQLIKALILGKYKELHKFHIELPTEYQFIFDIVSNANSKLDVDKWDYLKRDHHYLKHLCNPNMNIDEVFLKARVSECGQHIEYRYKDYHKIYNILSARWHFHRFCYQLPEFIISERILKKAIEETKPLINGHELSAIDAEHDMTSFLQLTDGRVLTLIEDHRLREFLKYETKFQVITEEEVSSEQETYNCTICIPSVSKFMEGCCLKFYGDVEEKSQCIDETESVNDIITFYCDESNQTVFYYVKSKTLDPTTKLC